MFLTSLQVEISAMSLLALPLLAFIVLLIFKQEEWMVEGRALLARWERRSNSPSLNPHSQTNASNKKRR